VRGEATTVAARSIYRRVIRIPRLLISHAAVPAAAAVMSEFLTASSHEKTDEVGNENS